MRRSLLLFLAVALMATSSFAHGRHGEHSISFDDDDSAAGCSALSVRFGGERVSVVSEDVPFHGSQLRVRSENSNGGIRVVGGTGSGYSVSVCKAVAPGVDPGAVRAVLAGNELTATGPENERWVAFFIVRAPRGASLDLHSSNGPISIRDVDGTIDAQAVNGPVSVRDSSGTINASTTNGPVSISGGSGDVRLRATNGPVSVKLSGSAWIGNLEASTQNGPVSLRMPRGFQSGVVVDALGSGPVSCRAEACAGQRFRLEDGRHGRPRRIELGSGPQVVRVSTVNGPVSVKEAE